MNKQKRNLTVALTIILALVLSVSCSAHSGKTDSKGGHYNSSTGEYHYHHGYPAHRHTNGECPYDFDDQTSHKTGSSSGTSSKETSETVAIKKTKIDIESVIIIVICSAMILWLPVMLFVMWVSDYVKQAIAYIKNLWHKIRSKIKGFLSGKP